MDLKFSWRKVHEKTQFKISFSKKFSLKNFFDHKLLLAKFSEKEKSEHRFDNIQVKVFVRLKMNFLFAILSLIPTLISSSNPSNPSSNFLF